MIDLLLTWPHPAVGSAKSMGAPGYNDLMYVYVDDPSSVAALVENARCAVHAGLGVSSLFGLGGVRPEIMARDGGSMQETLVMLNELLEAGLISQVEFDAKRAEILACL